MTLVTWAWFTSKQLLQAAMPRRWAHVQGVARTARHIAPMLPGEDGEVLVAAAWLHDIGYAQNLIDTGFHPLDGARYLLAHDAPARLCALVAHHSGAAAVAAELGLSAELAAFADEHTPARNALWYCDMTTGVDGDPVTFDQRISEIRARRGSTDPSVRALARNLTERAAAVERTELLLTGNTPLVASPASCLGSQAKTGSDKQSPDHERVNDADTATGLVALRGEDSR